MIQAGDLRERVLLQSKSVTRDAYGAEVISWADFKERWAEVTPLSGREYISMRQSQSDVTTRVRMRWLPGVSTTMRLLWRDVPYRISEVIDVEARSEELEILCTAEQSQMTEEGLHG